MLWDAGPQATVDDVVGLLRTRFGNELQAERFKAELKVRRRRTGESLQQLYQDISKLVALAYPNEGPALVNHVAKEAFVIALGDPTLQLKVIEREPKTVEDALNIAVKMEAYQASVVSPEPNKGAADHKPGTRSSPHTPWRALSKSFRLERLIRRARGGRLSRFSWPICKNNATVTVRPWGD